MEFLVLLGPPGSGKGTLSRRLQEENRFIPVSTGEEIRKQMADPQSEVGRASAPYMDRGDYIPDDLALSLFYTILEPMDTESRVVLDGFPRTVPQAIALAPWLEAKGHRLIGCVFLNLPVEVAVKRMEARLVCPDCRRTYPTVAGHPVGSECDACGGILIQREDDDPVRMKQRLRRHEEMTNPLREWFEDRKQLLEVDASAGTEDLRKGIVKHFNL
ncbi:nucleoside monophosphate kinase [Kiritimatiellaeota bacterium B1221]|nr:nucleoside monophosphate kinase [Kiritimatiellaeota bacterium B1221]